MKPSSEKMTPKYDPCRKFCKGDKVQVIRRDGRVGSTSILVGASAIVEEQEDNDNFVILRNPSPKGQPFICIHSLFLELVTPAEELETAAIFDDKKTGMWVVTKDNFTHAYFPYRMEIADNIANSKQEAKAAAEAERDRLKAEYRKEKE